MKVLDFGLAKAHEGEAKGDASESPTMTAAAIRAGVIMGSAAYMSPEQARGKRVDRRADIWAFAVVVYKMLTGRRAFEAEDISLATVGYLRSRIGRPVFYVQARNPCKVWIAAEDGQLQRAARRRDPDIVLSDGRSQFPE